MAINLTALPLEILTAILLSVPDFTTLLSLILSCRTIHSAFTSSSAVTSRIIGNAYYRSLPALFLPVACNHSYRLRMSSGGGGGAGKIISPAVLNTYIRILATTPIQTEREELTERLYARWESVRRLSLLFSRNRRLPTIEEELIKVDSAVYCLYICANYIHGVESSSSSSSLSSTNMVMMVDVVTEAVVVAKYLPAKYRELCLQLYDYIDANVYRMVSDSRSKAWWSEMGGQFGDWNSDAVIRSLEIGEIVNYIGNLEAWDSVKPVGARAIHARSRSLGAGRSVFGSINGAVSTTTGGRGEIIGGDGDSRPTRAASGSGGGESWPKEEPEASEYLLLSLWIRDSLRRHVMRPRGSELVRPLRDVLEKIGESLAE